MAEKICVRACVRAIYTRTATISVVDDYRPARIPRARYCQYARPSLVEFALDFEMPTMVLLGS